jgi:hypothetical protein
MDRSADRVYGIPLWTRLLMWAGVAVFSFFTGFALWEFFHPDPANPVPARAFQIGIPAVGSFALLFLYAAWSSERRIVIDDHGVTALLPGLAPRRLTWEQIRCIKERPLLQYLELRGGPGEAVVRIPYVVDNFAAAGEFISQRCARIHLAFDLPLVLSSGWNALLGHLFCVGISLLIGLPLLLNRDNHWLVGTSVFLVGPALSLGLFLFGFHTLVVDRDSLTMIARLRKRAIAFADVESFVVESTHLKKLGARTQTNLSLVMKLRNGEKMSLPAVFPYGVMHAQQFLQSLLDQRQERKSEIVTKPGGQRPRAC